MTESVSPTSRATTGTELTSCVGCFGLRQITVGVPVGDPATATLNVHLFIDARATDGKRVMTISGQGQVSDADLVTILINAHLAVGLSRGGEAEGQSGESDEGECFDVHGVGCSLEYNSRITGWGFDALPQKGESYIRFPPDQGN